MLLSVAERIVLLNALPPAEGNAVLLRSVRRLRHALSFTDQELADWKVRDLGGGAFIWDTGTAANSEIDITGPAQEYVANCLRKIEVVGALHETLLSIYEQLCPEP